ncbi:MAG: class I SAM-dependent methyltransferase [Candidatus Eisenbacteria bacterium]|nr:class I SAM-dependent methyltransferase [Candidatus Eisenbacteria bacterium]
MNPAELYGRIWLDGSAGLESRLEQSLAPRSADLLLDTMGRLGLRAEDHLLDLGCRDSSFSYRLAARYGCRVTGVDLVLREVSPGLVDPRVRRVAGRLEAVPLRAGCARFIWCRDVLNHVELSAALPECARLLARGGSMLIFQTFAGPLMEPREAERLYAALAVDPRNMDRAYVEAIAREAGFVVAERDPVGSEWRERRTEDGDPALLDDLLRVARLRRREVLLAAEFGREVYEATYAAALWGIYQMLGKLAPEVLVLRRV